MNKMRKNKIMAWILMLMMLVSVLPPVEIFAADVPTLTVATVTAVSSAATVDVPVSITHNPGILGATLTLTYDTELTLISAAAGEAFSPLTMTKPGQLVSGCTFVWDGQEIQAEDIKDGVILTLTFMLPETAESGTKYAISMAYSDGDIVDGNINPVSVTIVKGGVEVIDYMYGDLNSDQKVNTSDVILLRRSIAGGYSQTINENAADVNLDTKKNATDVILMRRFIAGGYGITFPYVSGTCQHTMQAIPYKAPTTVAEGNIAYWQCLSCKKYFSDASGTTEITWEETVLPPLNVNEYAIVYNNIYTTVDGADDYLAAQSIVNPNPEKYNTEEGLLLEPLSVPGYTFNGWTDKNGLIWDEIPSGTTGRVILYANWKINTYKIQYACDMDPQPDDTYCVNTGKQLPKPERDKYTFVGWTDKNGHLWESVPVGTTGNMELFANWASHRNKAIAKEKLDKPLVFEDAENGLILFAYEIGEIQNVPLFTTLKLNCVNGIISTHSWTGIEEISATQASEIAKVISNATTNTTAWTLSSDWNETTQVSETYIEETGQTREEAETISKSESNNYFLNTSSSSSQSTVSVDGYDYKVSVGNSGSNETHDNTEYSTEWNLSAGGKISSKLGPVDMEASVNASTGESVKRNSGGTSQSEWHDNSDKQNYGSTTSACSKSWNSSSGYNNSKSTSQSSTISNVMSKTISEQKGYGESYSSGGSNSESQALASTETQSDEYSSALTYYTSKIKTTTTTYSSTGNTSGDYRMVMAGTVHVFGVVGYDIAEQSYFVYTYNVLDDMTEEYLDYSYDGSFSDYETGVIPFEIPYFVEDYVNSKVLKTEGLVFNPDTGMIVDYVPIGDKADSIVLIPSYVSIDNNDGTFSSVKVTGIESGVFKNNTDIVAVRLGDYITEIPDSLFEGCDSLEHIICPGVTKIGEKAFSGCTSLGSYILPVEVTEIEENAFEGVPEVKATASSIKMAQAVASCGARNIVLDISSIPDVETDGMELNIGNIESFELQGKDKEYKGINVKSDADRTVINGVTITENTKIPLEISSSEVLLDRVTIEASGIALVLKAESTNLKLNRTINIHTESDHAVLSKDITIAPLSTEIVGKLNVTGNVLLAGEISGDQYLNVTEGEILYISDEEFENFLTSRKVTFDACGGSVGVENMMVPYNGAYGELPYATRDYYTFDGWYTEAEGGEKVTADTLMTSLVDITLYAHWIQNDVSAWTVASEIPEGVEIVNRKYAYTLTSYTESTSTSLSGWNCYDSYWIESGSGNFNYASFPNGYGSDTFRKNFKTSAVSPYENATNKRVVNTYHAGYIYWHWCRGNHSLNLQYSRTVSDYKTNEFWDYHSFSSSENKTTYADGCYQYSNRNACGDSNWWYKLPYYYCAYTDYYKMFKYTKNEEKESATYPTGDNISNIQEWVQYRAK